MERSKYPEKVPFRLTRMLVNAMEVSGIKGTYRSTCVNVMSVLRENRDSLNAMLEAFVHDPLIGWKLLHKEDEGPDEEVGVEGRSGVNHDHDDDDDDEDDDDDDDDYDSDDDIEDDIAGAAQAATAAAAATASKKGKGGAAVVARGARRKSQQFGPASSLKSKSSKKKGLRATSAKNLQVAAFARSAQKSSAGRAVSLLDMAGDDHELSKEAIRVTQRIQMKLNGRDFPNFENDGRPVPVEDQVDGGARHDVHTC